jgi:hypothetical protein
VCGPGDQENAHQRRIPIFVLELIGEQDEEEDEEDDYDYDDDEEEEEEQDEQEENSLHDTVTALVESVDFCSVLAIATSCPLTSRRSSLRASQMMQTKARIRDERRADAVWTMALKDADTDGSGRACALRLISPSTLALGVMALLGVEIAFVVDLPDFQSSKGPLFAWQSQSLTGDTIPPCHP